MFELTDEQRDIKKAAREFAEGEFPGIASECDINETFPIDLWKKACELGLIGVSIEEKYEGAGLGLLEYVLILEEFWRVDPGCGNVLFSTLGSELIQQYGNEEQKKEYLRPLTKGKAIIGTIVSEDYINNDFHYVRNSNENEYLINGSNKFIFNGTNANYLVIVGRRNPKNSSGVGGFSTFIIEKSKKGVKTVKLSNKLGIRASDISEVILEDVRISSRELVGIEGEGLEQFNTFLDRLRIYNSAQAIGASQGCLERAIKYSRERVQFGHPIGWFQMIQFKIAEMATRIEAARNLCYKSAWDLDHGGKDKRIHAMASWFSREVAVSVTSEALQIHGGYGYMKDLDIERFYRDVQSLELFGVSREREKIALAKEMLGKI
ncbi:MAG: acyl-CoA dehydrogenase family protein [Thermodesulfobacteriota bacterium]|jgi:alkylation response protein AidB-like acyl-CoA dehydrogenase